MTIDFIGKGIEDTKKVAAQRKAFTLVKKRQKENISKIIDLKGKIAKLKSERELSVGDKKILDQAIWNLKKNGFKVFIAQTKDEAITHIINVIGKEKKVIKSKSNTTREITLNAMLEAKGIEIIETDIGDRIIQISHENPSHPTGPLSHLTIKDISRLAKKHYKTKVKPEAENLVELIKKDISEHLKTTNIGITGANAISAEEGAVFLVHNEGNIREVMMNTKKHIIIAGIDKIYPNLEETLNMGKLQTFYATGSLMPSFMDIIGGPSKTADIEKKLIKGLYGPDEITVILLDNGRDEIILKGYKELLNCIGCGSCLLHCPVYNLMGNKFGKENKFGGQGVVYNAVLNGSGDTGLKYCVTCGRCKENCPLSIDITKYIKKLRNENRIKGGYFESHLIFLMSSLKFGVFQILSRFMRTN